MALPGDVLFQVATLHVDYTLKILLAELRLGVVDKGAALHGRVENIQLDWTTYELLTTQLQQLIETNLTGVNRPPLLTGIDLLTDKTVVIPMR